MQYHVISADSHVCEPGDLWLNYIDPKYKDKAPRLMHEKDTDIFWCPDVKLAPIGLIAGAGRAQEARRHGRWDQDIPKGGYDPDARVEAMTLDGVDAEVLYPTITMRMYAIPDQEFQYACLEAYNTWVADLCKARPEQLKGLAVISVQDIERAVQELYRAKKMGLVGAMVPVFPDEERQYNDPSYDPFWAAAQELDMPISLHINTFRQSVFNKTMVDTVVKPVWVQRSIASLIFFGVFERFPGLKVVSAENDASWAAHFLERMDHSFAHSHTLYEMSIKGKLKPSEYFHRNVFLTFMEDMPAITARYHIGVENIMWSSDYPHHNATWPESRRVIAEHFPASVPEADKHKIICGNAERLYHFA